MRDWPAALCARAGSNLDARTWQQYFGDAAYRRLCADFPGPPDGDLDAPERPLPRLG